MKKIMIFTVCVLATLFTTSCNRNKFRYEEKQPRYEGPVEVMGLPVSGDTSAFTSKIKTFKNLDRIEVSKYDEGEINYWFEDEETSMSYIKGFRGDSVYVYRIVLKTKENMIKEVDVCYRNTDAHSIRTALCEKYGKYYDFIEKFDNVDKYNFEFCNTEIEVDESEEIFYHLWTDIRFIDKNVKKEIEKEAEEEYRKEIEKLKTVI